MTASRSISIRARRAIAGVGLVGLAMVAVPAAALADTAPAPTPAAPQCSPQARWQAMAETAPAVASYLAAHPDVASELAKVATLPKEQRKAEWKNFRAGHQQEVKDLQAARHALHDYRKACHRR
ncbi:hemophore-related protein [Rhodococcus spelaei]|uniref:Hemophore-related protein n=1 Tax=Rhodococcus spelaei TaxID=2546320 RepID=A0A541BPP3_9NOCA|nr:hemophore-related protein [Rhodococcus spelaei]TQF74218.1 hemophore-related protein [Rhodococcus spelaei]